MADSFIQVEECFIILKKLNTKEYLIHYFMYMKFLKKALLICGDRNHVSRCQGLGMEGRH